MYKKSNRTLMCYRALNIPHTEIILAYLERPGFQLLIATVFVKEKLSKYECDKNCRSKSHFSTVWNLLKICCNLIPLQGIKLQN